MVQYAIKRFRDHIHRFTRLYEMLTGQEEIDEGMAERG
jgi:1,4-alpha-glucan branching enzyme